MGDQLFGGSGGDWLYGNLRQEILVGGGGNDMLGGDYLIGPKLLENRNADIVGGRDRLFGDTGEDKATSFPVQREHRLPLGWTWTVGRWWNSSESLV